MKKISIVLPNLRGGGAERQAIYLANDWLTRGYQVELILMKSEGELFQLLSPGIQVTSLNADRIRHSIIPLRRQIKLSCPDVVWVNMWPLTSAAVISWLLADRQGKLFLIDHIQLSISCTRELGVTGGWLKFVMNSSYPFATGIMAVSKGVAADMCRLSSFADRQIKVIYNPAARGVTASPAPTEMREELWGKGFRHHILTAGSFKLQKNHIMLLNAFAKLPHSLNAKLTILGDGELRSAMEKHISELGLQGRVSLPGFYQDTNPWFRSADLFVLSSDWEGFGNVIVEAFECGVPVVSTDCPSGPAEIMEDGRYGRLVPVGDPDALASAMITSLSEAPDRVALMQRAKDFSVERISKEYLDYFGLPHHV
jgi:glycosyltransferase involved in cell wall biosynthesis